MKKWWQFRLATLLLVVTAIAAWLGYYFSPAKRAQRAVQSLQKTGADVFFDYQRVPGEQRVYSARAEPTGLFHDAEWIRLQDTSLTVEQLKPLKELAGIRNIYLVNCKISDEHMPHFAGLRQLEMLTLRDHEITDDGLAHLAGLTNLDNLELAKNKIHGDGLRHLVHLKALKTLYLHDNPISDDALVHLRNMHTLERLGLAGTRVTDGALKHLRELKKLKYLGLSGTGVTKAAKEELRAALPNCDVE